MDGGAWWATVHGVSKELDMTELLHFHFLKVVVTIYHLMVTLLLASLKLMCPPQNAVI